MCIMLTNKVCYASLECNKSLCLLAFVIALILITVTSSGFSKVSHVLKRKHFSLTQLSFRFYWPQISVHETLSVEQFVVKADIFPQLFKWIMSVFVTTWISWVSVAVRINEASNTEVTKFTESHSTCIPLSHFTQMAALKILFQTDLKNHFAFSSLYCTYLWRLTQKP